MGIGTDQETLCKFYLELANVVPVTCISSREIALKEQIDVYGLALLMISSGCADPKQVAADALAKFTTAAVS